MQRNKDGGISNRSRKKTPIRDSKIILQVCALSIKSAPIIILMTSISRLRRHFHGRFANHQLRLEYNMPGSISSGPRGQLHEQTYSRRPHLLTRNRNRGKGRLGHAAPGNIVHANHRHIMRYAYAAFTQCIQHTKRTQISRAEDPVKPNLALDEFAQRLRAMRLPAAAFHQKPPVKFQASRSQGPPVSHEPLIKMRIGKISSD